MYKMFDEQFLKFLIFNQTIVGLCHFIYLNCGIDGLNRSECT